MTGAAWTVVLITSAALLPLVLLALVRLGEATTAHPLFLAARRRCEEFGEERPLALRFLLLIPVLPALAYFASTGNWANVALFVLQSLVSYRLGRGTPSRRAQHG